MKTSDLSQIMKTAWQFFRTTGFEFAVCLKRVGAKFMLLQALKKGIMILISKASRSLVH